MSTLQLPRHGATVHAAFRAMPPLVERLGLEAAADWSARVARVPGFLWLLDLVRLYRRIDEHALERASRAVSLADMRRSFSRRADTFAAYHPDAGED